MQAPTTLLAQVDAAIGGKTAVNLPEGKNLVGAFHQPIGVFADVATLATLPPREYRAGLGEVAKYALMPDGARVAAIVDRHAAAVVARDLDVLTELVAACAAMKAHVVAADPQERTGLRATLNLGHTLGARARVGRAATSCCTARRSRSVWCSRVRSPVRSNGSTARPSRTTATWSPHSICPTAVPGPRRSRRAPDVDAARQEVGRWAHLRAARARSASRPCTIPTPARSTSRSPRWVWEAEPRVRATILLLSGPNLNLLGEREPEIYGTTTLADLVAGGDRRRRRRTATPSSTCSRTTRATSSTPSTARRNRCAAIVINAGAFTHYSFALADALATFEGVKVELHISNPEAREHWRHESVIAPYMTATMAGFGAAGYRLAVEGAIAKLGAPS